MSQQPPGSTPAINPWLVAIAVMSGTFMVVLDTTVVNVSLPHIAGSLSVTVDEATWALTTYLAANAVILPITGWLGNFFGRKRILLFSTITFTIASFMCGLSPSLWVLILWRVIQGATGGVMQPISQAVLLEAFPPAERGKAMAFWGVGILVAPILGPVLGGWLTDTYSWRWVFYINVPVGVASVWLVRRFLFDPPYIKRTSATVDGWGLSLLALGIASLQIGLDQGQEQDWFSSRWITALFLVAAVTLVAFVFRELNTRHPVVDLTVFKERTFATGIVLITAMGLVLYGSLVLLPILLQTLLGYSPLAAGYAMAPRGIGAVIAMPIVGVMMSKVDPRHILGLGFILGAFTLYWLGALDLATGFWDVFWPQLVQGVALGCLFVPLTTLTMDRISNAGMGNATSIFNLTRNVGGSVGIAMVSTMLVRHRQVHTAILSGHVNPYSTPAREWLHRVMGGFMARGADSATAAKQALAAASGTIARQAAMLSFIDVFRFLGLLFLILTPLVWTLRKPQHHEKGAGLVAME